MEWRLANVMPIFRKVWEDDPGSYRPISLTSVPGKVMEWIISGAIMDQSGDQAQSAFYEFYGFMNGRSCLADLISFYDKVTRLVDEGKAVSVAYLDFSKAFDTIPHNILVEKLAAHGLDGHTQKHWLNGWAQRVVVSGVKSSWWLVTSGVAPGFSIGAASV